MIIRINQSQGIRFWGCSEYPACKGTRNLTIDQQANGTNNGAESIPSQVLAITDRQKFIDSTVDRETKLQTPISELPIGEPITKPLFEKYQRVLSIDDVFVITDQEFASIPNFDDETLGVLRMQVRAFMYHEDLWDRAIVPVSVPDLSGDSQDWGDSFFQKSFLPYHIYDKAQEDEAFENEHEDPEDDEDAEEYYLDENDLEDMGPDSHFDISGQLEASGRYVETISYDYHGDLGDDEEPDYEEANYYS